MEEGSGSALKWIVAVVALALVVLLSAPAALEALTGSIRFEDNEPELPTIPDQPAAPTLTPVEDGTAVASTDFLAVDRIVQDMDADALTVQGPEQAMVAAFPLIEGDEECIGTVELEISLTATDNEGRIGVFPSGVFTPLLLADGDGAIPSLTPGPAALAVTNGSLGRLRWDVTDLYRTWVRGSAFGDITIPGGVPFTVAVHGVDGDGDSFTFATLESGEATAPAITWTGAPECG